MKAILTVIAVYAAVIGLACGGALVARISQAHESGRIHSTAQQFDFHFDDIRGVYCGWRHSYEGISCVKIGD